MGELWALIVELVKETFRSDNNHRRIGMTVGELITALSKEDPDRVVVMSRDPEGNGYSPLHSHWCGKYEADHGEVGLEELSEVEREAGYTDEDVMEDGVKAVILCPVN